MTRFDSPAHASCDCGAVVVTVRGALTRFYCHCSICQRANNAAFGDPVFLWRHHLKVQDPAKLTWTRHRWTPINMNRGSCRACGRLIVEHLAASPLSVVIGRTFQDQSLLPPAQGHIFYENRAADVDDGLPKEQKYLSSEWAVTKWLLAGMFGR